MMSAAALLAKTPKPSDQEIDAAMNGNICRCGTYLRIRQAIHKAASLAAAGPARAAGAVASGDGAGRNEARIATATSFHSSSPNKIGPRSFLRLSGISVWRD